MNLKLALKRFEQCVTAESDNRRLAVEAIQFRYGDQWPEQVKRERELEGRPCLTLNRVPQYIRQVINDIRMSRPAIKVRPVDSASDPETANIVNGLIRQIEKSSNAEIAYDWAAEYAVTAGWGYFRVNTRYVDPLSFDQEIYISRVPNVFSVYMDPDAIEPDGSDAKFCFVVETMSRDAFKERYPKADSEWDPKTGEGLAWEHWYQDDKVQVAEYWVVEEKVQTISMMEDGSIWPGEVEGAISTRQTTIKRVKQYIITGTEVLDETEWAGQYIPIIPVYGQELNIEGKTHLTGMVRDMMDPQRQYNYWRSASTERVALAPKAPFIGPIGSFKSSKWRNANQKNYAYLEYNPVNDERGNPLPPPQRQPPVDVSPGLAQEISTAAQEFASVTGIYEANLGQVTNERSGRAILQRQREGDVSTYHYIDNLARAIRHCGRVLVDLIPKIYDTPRIVHILQPGGESEPVQINAPYTDEKGKDREYNLQMGKYDVVVDVGPSFATQRQEAAEAMMDLIGAMPNAAPLIGDIVAKSFDWPGADEISDRLKMMLPPEVLAGDNPQLQNILKQNQAQMQQMQGYIAQLERALQDRTRELDIKEGELGAKLKEVRRKYEEMNQDFAKDMTELELEYVKDVRGSVV